MLGLSCRRRASACLLPKKRERLRVSTVDAPEVFNGGLRLPIASILRAGQGKRVNLVISGSDPIAGSPIYDTVHD